MANKYTYSPPCSESVLRDLYNEGMTQIEIAKKLETSQKVIWSAMKRFGIKARVAAKRDQWGERNHQWKGNQATYAAFHYRLTSRYGQPQCCDNCKTTDPNKSYDWACVGDYSKIEDYKRLCRSCHFRLDGIANNLGQFKGQGGAKCRKES